MTSHSLLETIENFQSFILHDDKMIEADIAGKDEKFREERLDVYYQAYSLRLLETMGRAFPVINKLAGDELFEKIARDYIKSFPSNHFSIRFFGRHFSKFLEGHPDAQLVWVEMAAFEWALGEVIDAPDAPQLSFEDLTSLSPEAWSDLVLKVHPSLQELSLFYPAPALWQAVQFNTELPIIERQEKPVTWLVWRFNLRAYFISITDEQLAMLRAIQADQPFAEVCAGLCELLSEEQVIAFASQTLRQWVNEGIFSEFKIIG